MLKDTLGHAAGDLLLACVAGRLREFAMTQIVVASSQAVVGRLAGDEFTLFFPQLPAEETAQSISRAVQYALGERLDVGGQQIDLGASIGVAFYPQHGETLRSEEHTSELQSLMRTSYAVFCLKRKRLLHIQPR